MEDPSTMADSPEYEMVCEEIPGQSWTDRLRVDTGWLYRTTVLAGVTTRASGTPAVALAFVPDRATP